MRALHPVLLAMVLLSARTASAAPLSVAANLSERSVLVGDAVTLEISVVSHVDGQIEIKVPKVPGLAELSRSRSEGTSVSWSGAGQQITREYTVTIEYEAQKAGKITIPPVSAKAGDESAESAPVTLEVTSSDEAREPGVARPGEVEPPEPGEQQLFVRYQVDRSTAWVGQQILVDLDIYAHPNLNFSIEDNVAPPALDGFWKEVVEQPQRLARRVESVRGKSYHVYRLWRLALFPLEPGTRTLPAVQLSFAVNRSIFGGSQRDRRRSLPLKLEVKPLPVEGRPLGFQAANVGAYTLDATVEPNRVPAGKAVVLSLVLSGRGNLKAAKLPALSTIPGFRVYPPTIKDEVDTSAAGLSGRKKAELLLLPEQGGRLEIPPLELVVFNPESERYERLSTASLRITVDGDPQAVAPPTTLPPPGLQEPPPTRPAERAELRPIRFRSRLEARRPWPFEVELALLLCPPALFLGALFLERAFAKLREETPASRRRADERLARVAISEAAALAAEGRGADAYARASGALLALGGARLGERLTGLTREELAHTLLARGAPPELARGLVAELEAADFARYAARTEPEELARAEERWRTLLDQLSTWTPREVE